MSLVMPPTVNYGPHEVSTKTEIGKHLWTHERKPGWTAKNNPYPRMLYKAYKGEDGVLRCMDAEPKPWLYQNQEMYRMACEQVQHFNLSCQKTVGINEKGEPAPDLGPAQEKAAKEEGWRNTPQEAMEFLRNIHKEMAQAAAERNYQDRNMSEKARAEIAAAEADTPDQVPEIKEKPLVKRGRPSKAAQNAA